MTFTYDLSTDTGKVRFHVGDTRADEAAFTDDEIGYALSVGSVGEAVISLLNRQLAELSRQPDFGSPDLRLSYANAITALKAALAQKRREFGLYDLPDGEAIVLERSDTYGTALGEELLRLGVDPDRDRLERDTYRRFN
ncbi:MAG: hypothetical protein OXI72_10930 [Gemmatimonadota bacterium]|nr:hypothetical protein [Gemmatimonadota bacterium]